MLHIDVFTKGNEFKDTQNNVYIVTDNTPIGKKILLELELVEPVQELIPD